MSKSKLQGMGNSILSLFRSLSSLVADLAATVAINWNKDTVGEETVSAWVKNQPRLQNLVLDVTDDEIILFQTAWKLFLDFLGKQKVCAFVCHTIFSDLAFMFFCFSPELFSIFISELGIFLSFLISMTMCFAETVCVLDRLA